MPTLDLKVNGSLREGYRAHNALWDAEVAGRLYFAMRGIAYAALQTPNW